MKTIACSERLTKERADAVGTRLVSKEELFRDTDILSIHLVLVDVTEVWWARASFLRRSQLLGWSIRLAGHGLPRTSPHSNINPD
jgi:hypothetical protein